MWIAIAVGRERLTRGEAQKAEEVWAGAKRLLQPGELSSSALELQIELASLYSAHPELDPGGQKFAQTELDFSGGRDNDPELPHRACSPLRRAEPVHPEGATGGAFFILSKPSDRPPIGGASKVFISRCRSSVSCWSEGARSRGRCSSSADQVEAGVVLAAQGIEAITRIRVGVWIRDRNFVYSVNIATTLAGRVQIRYKRLTSKATQATSAWVFCGCHKIFACIGLQPGFFIYMRCRIEFLRSSREVCKPLAK